MLNGIKEKVIHREKLIMTIVKKLILAIIILIVVGNITFIAQAQDPAEVQDQWDFVSDYYRSNTECYPNGFASGVQNNSYLFFIDEPGGPGSCNWYAAKTAGIVRNAIDAWSADHGGRNHLCYKWVKWAGGIHHFIVVYEKGKKYGSGKVLDPWHTQRPEIYDELAHSVIFPIFRTDEWKWPMEPNRSSRPETPAGGDHPDDFFDVSDPVLGQKVDWFAIIRMAVKKNMSIGYKLLQHFDIFEHYGPDYDYTTVEFPEITIEELYTLNQVPDVAILTEGYCKEASNLIWSLGQPVNTLNLRDFTLEIAERHPILIIPSGGLCGLDSLPTFKSKLEQYVANGGTLIVFSQQHGYDFSALPGGEIGGYGWLEDQSCHYNSAGIATYHPIVSGQSSVTPNLNVDGYFTKWPQNATILLKRTKNGMPAMVMYNYGQGSVIATTLYSDWADGHYQGTEDETRLIQDLVAWAKDPTVEIREYARGDDITIPISITNNANTTATELVFFVVDGAGNVFDEIIVPINLVPGETGGIFSYTAPSSLGIWHLNYNLRDSEGNIIQRNFEVEQFAVTKYQQNPNGFIYQGAEITFSVSTPDENYAYGSDVPFTVHVWNHGSTDRELSIACKWTDWWLRKIGDTSTTISVSAYGEASFTYAINTAGIKRQIIFTADVSENSNGIGSTLKAVNLFTPSINIEIKTDREKYNSGENVSIFLALENSRPITSNALVTLRVVDPENNKIFEDIFNTTLPAHESENSEFNLDLPISSINGIYIVTCEVQSDGEKAGTSSAYFEVLKGHNIRVDFDKPNRIYRIGEDLGMDLKVLNAETVSWDSNLNISIPAFNFTDTRHLSLNPGQEEIIHYSFTLPDSLETGKYQITVNVEKYNYTYEFYFFIPESKLILSSDIGTYNAGENVGINLSNIGGVDTMCEYSFKLSDSCLVTVYENSGMENVPAGESKTLVFPIPVQAVSGDYYLMAEGKNLSTGKMASILKTITISGISASFLASTNKDVYFTDETIGVSTNITNLNGSIDDATLNLRITTPSQSIFTVDDWQEIFDNMCGFFLGQGMFDEDYWWGIYDIICDYSVDPSQSIFTVDDWQEIFDHIWGYYGQEMLDEVYWAFYYYLVDSGQSIFTVDDLQEIFDHIGSYYGYLGQEMLDEVYWAFYYYLVDSGQSIFTVDDLQEIFDHIWGYYGYLGQEMQAEDYWWGIYDIICDYSVDPSQSITTEVGDVVWEENIPLSIAEGAGADIFRDITLNSTGKLSFISKLLSETSQIIAQDEKDFYIIEEDTSLRLKTDKQFYKPDEDIIINGEVTNYAQASKDCYLLIKADEDEIFSLNFSLDPGESYSFNTITSQSSSFVLEGTVDGVTIADLVRIEHPNVNVTLLAPDVVGFAEFNVRVLIQNIGNVGADLDVSIGDDIWNITLPAGQSKLIETTMNITEDTILNVVISGDISKIVQKEITFGERAEINITSQTFYLVGPVEIPFTVENTGLLDTEFEVTFSIDDQTVVKNFSLPRGQNMSDTVSFNLSRGTYLLRYIFPFGEGSVGVKVAIEPEFSFTQVPTDLFFQAGQESTIIFNVQNTGDTEGQAILPLDIPGIYQETQSVWLKPGEVKEVSFTFTVPDDLEEKNYRLIYSVNGVEGELSVFVEGAHISVNATLDKDLYEDIEGETAYLTLDVRNERDFPIDLYASVRFNEYEEERPFYLGPSGEETLEFEIPVNFNGRKLFYGIYYSSGRALHLNALYLHKKEDIISLYTDKQVYDIGDIATVFIETGQSGTLTLKGSGLDEVLSVEGSTTIGFTIPEERTGTYYIDYTFDYGETFSSSYPFDISGYSARIIEVILNKNTYNPGDTLTMDMKVDVNRDILATLKYWIYGAQENIIDEFEIERDLAQGENEVYISRILSPENGGIHSIVYRIYTDIPANSQVLLASGAKYFDVKDVIAPTLTATSPINGATDADVSISISTTFSEGMDQLSVLGAFSIFPSVAGVFNWIGDTLYFIPEADLNYDATYTVTIAERAKDLAGNALAHPYSWQFSTISIAIPGDIDGDGDVDFADYNLFRSTLGKCSGDAGFIAEADYDEDGCVTYADYRIWYGYYRNQ
jgi:hypothetical protein